MLAHTLIPQLSHQYTQNIWPPPPQKWRKKGENRNKYKTEDRKMSNAHTHFIWEYIFYINYTHNLFYQLHTHHTWEREHTLAFWTFSNWVSKKATKYHVGVHKFLPTTMKIVEKNLWLLSKNFKTLLL